MAYNIGDIVNRAVVLIKGFDELIFDYCETGKIRQLLNFVPDGEGIFRASVHMVPILSIIHL
jgi:hypothetical protein